MILGTLELQSFCGCLQQLAKILEPYLVVLNSLPKSALAPLLIVWLGAQRKNHHRRRHVCGHLRHQLSISIPVFGRSDPDKRKLIRTLGGSKKDELQNIVLPCHRFPLILASIMKVNIGLCAGRRHHRGIHRCQTGAWLSDHLWQPDVPAGMHCAIFFLHNQKQFFLHRFPGG